MHLCHFCPINDDVNDDSIHCVVAEFVINIGLLILFL